MRLTIRPVTAILLVMMLALSTSPASGRPHFRLFRRHQQKVCTTEWAPTVDRSNATSSRQSFASPSTSAGHPRTTSLGTQFMVQPQFYAILENKIRDLRQQVREQREAGKFIVYISLPLTARGGGHQATNQALSAFVKRQLESRYGIDRLWALSPGQVESTIPAVGSVTALGGDYMYMWTQVLAGNDGLGTDFDLVYFMGPQDYADFFNLGTGAYLDLLDSYVDKRAATDDVFRTEVAENPAARRAFVRYYGLRASAAFSSGALDEWNIFHIINSRREIGDQIQMFFDGRAISPGEMNSPARRGYQLPLND